MNISVGFLLAAAVALVAFLGLLGIVPLSGHILWGAMLALALAVLLGGWAPWAPRRTPPA